MAKHFYQQCLRARIGWESDQRLDILPYGHQITLHHRPDEVLPGRQ